MKCIISAGVHISTNNIYTAQPKTEDRKDDDITDYTHSINEADIINYSC